MKLLNKLSILHRMLFGFVVVFIVFVLFCFYTFNQIDALNKQVHMIYNHPLQVSNAALEANVNAVKIYRSLKDLIISKDPVEFEAATTRINHREEDVFAQLDIIREFILEDEGKKLESDARELLIQWKTIRDKEIALILQDKIDEAKIIHYDDNYQHAKMLESKLIAINRYARNKANKFHKQAEESKTGAFGTLGWAILGMALFSAGFSLLIAFSIMRDIHPIRDSMVESAHSGELKKVIVDGNNEITDMAESYNILINNINNYDWLKEGLNKLNIALTGKDNSEKVAEAALNILCKYTNSGYGLFYGVDQETQTCNVLSSYALPAKLAATCRDVIGQVIKDREPVLISIKNESEFVIKSGLTEKLPVNSYVFPLVDEGNVVGVVELASCQKYSKIELAFFKSSVDIIAVSLASARKSETVNKLFLESQQLAQKLQIKEKVLAAQNEELRAKEEELIGQNEELQAKEEELSQQNDELKAKEEELTSQNEELQAKEEELNQQNEELFEAFEKLKKSEEQVKQAFKELRDSNLQLQEAHQYKNRFLSTMSHELRTPLNAIIGFSQSLEKQYFGALNDKQIEYVLMIYNSGQHLLALINDILDIAKIDSGSMTLQQSIIAPCSLIEEIVSLMDQQFKDKGICLSYIIDSNLKHFKADEKKCKQILLNLLSNALKYTPEGGNVTISVRIEGNDVKFNVTDTGIGIKDEDLENLFSDFYQTDGTRDQALGGTGIGLALCKRLVEIQNGQIGVESQENNGSTFWFNLPLE